MDRFRDREKMLVEFGSLEINEVFEPYEWPFIEYVKLSHSKDSVNATTLDKLMITNILPKTKVVRLGKKAGDE